MDAATTQHRSTTAPADRRTRILADTASLAGDDTLAPVIARVLEHVATEDLIERAPRDLVAAVTSLQQLAAHRGPQETLVRVLTPTVRQHDWSTRHSVVQICTDDCPFLVDSITAAIGDAGRAVHLFVHPLLQVDRDDDGRMQQVRRDRPPSPHGVTESWMHIEIDRLPGDEAARLLTESLRAVLDDVRAAVADWDPMRQACEDLALDIARRPPAVVAEQVVPTQEFLRWLAHDHFTFIGYREYTLVGEGEGEGEGEGMGLGLAPTEGTGLGILRDRGPEVSRLRPQAQRQARDPRLLTITKANSRSTVHRPVYLDYIGVRTFDDAGQVVGEKRFLGLFTSTAYAESVTRLPIASDKADAVLSRAGFTRDSHSGKHLGQILETYPRDELFAIDIDHLTTTVTAVADLARRRRAEIFIRTDEFGRFVTALVYVPRDRYTTAVRLRIEAILRERFGTDTLDHTTRLSDGALAQLYFVLRAPGGESIADVDPTDLRAEVMGAIRTWEERLADAVHASDIEEDDANRLLSGIRFSEAYKEDIDPGIAAEDLRRIASVVQTGAGSVHLGAGQRPDERRFKVFSSERLTLTRVLPVLTNLGVEVVDERPYSVRAASADLHVYDFGLRLPMQRWPSHGAAFEDAFVAVWDGVAESDLLNGLVLATGLTWRQIVVLRAIGRYLRQIDSTFSMEYLEEVLLANPYLATGVVRLFEVRLDPARPGGDARAEASDTLERDLLHALDRVVSLDADRILRTFIGIVKAVRRTSYYQRGADGAPKPSVSMKLDCRLVPGLPAPHPMAEIWVYAPEVEGVHLRFGPVARGGLRWSDRREDFRTEVLGLVKAQMVKNAVIVPTGSKGGFIGKRLPDPAVDRGAWVAAGQDAYRTFITGMLDITDNRLGGEIVGPADVVRHDDDDPYLVVAADKGTATFSDIANEVSRAHDFWLDDAFASGGSAGYDHKAMGITARGAWESVKRHFRELGVDSQREDITVVGIGDMSGDVFGNGMLLSRRIRLVAAFDHRHVFLDPGPDAERSFLERERLFGLTTSSWADYDTSLISAGGGVYPRGVKAIPVTEQVRRALGIDDDATHLTPAELIHRVLQAPVDLLWNGGIGTYVKASTQTHAEVGDKANDAIRVDGSQLRARVVAEGGNLGATQRGRIEAARAGVQINTDAIDNSAGVGTSDKEVNIKILLTEQVRAGELALPQRNALLASMTDEVAAQVLRDNYEQNVLLGNSRANSAVMLPVHARFIHWLVEHAGLDRELEDLPNDAEIQRRLAAGEGLSRPEFAVLVAYAKLNVKHQLARTDLADDPWFLQTLTQYFPTPLHAEQREHLPRHPLRREIIINAIANSMVNRGGITFAFRAADETGAPLEQITRAFVVAREIFDLDGFVAQVEATDNVVTTATQTDLYLTFRRLLDRTSRWLVLNRATEIDIAQEIARFTEPMSQWRPRLPELVQGAEAAAFSRRADGLVQAGLDTALATQGAGLLPSLSLLDIVDSATPEHPVAEIASVYFSMAAMIGFSDLLDRVAGLPQDDRWDSLARSAMRDDLSAVLIELTHSVLKRTANSDDVSERLRAWADAGGIATARALASLAEVRDVDEPGVATISVALRTLRSLVR